MRRTSSVFYSWVATAVLTVAAGTGTFLMMPQAHVAVSSTTIPVTGNSATVKLTKSSTVSVSLGGSDDTASASASISTDSSSKH